MNIPNAIAHRATGPLHPAITADVLVPGDHGYDEARRAWNLAVDQRPAAVVLAESSADVAQAVRFARERGMRMARRALATAPGRWSRSMAPCCSGPRGCGGWTSTRPPAPRVPKPAPCEHVTAYPIRMLTTVSLACVRALP